MARVKAQLLAAIASDAVERTKVITELPPYLPWYEGAGTAFWSVYRDRRK